MCVCVSANTHDITHTTRLNFLQQVNEVMEENTIPFRFVEVSG